MAAGAPAPSSRVVPFGLEIATREGPVPAPRAAIRKAGRRFNGMARPSATGAYPVASEREQRDFSAEPLVSRPGTNAIPLAEHRNGDIRRGTRPPPCLERLGVQDLAGGGSAGCLLFCSPDRWARPAAAGRAARIVSMRALEPEAGDGERVSPR